MYSLAKGITVLLIGLVTAANTGEPGWLIVAAVGLVFIGWGLLLVRVARH